MFFFLKGFISEHTQDNPLVFRGYNIIEHMNNPIFTFFYSDIECDKTC